MDCPAIEISQLCKRFDTNWIHKDLSLTIPQNQMVAIVGGSGCGKSTLLKQILMLEAPTSGSIKLLGCDCAKASEQALREVRAKTGVMFQQGALFSSYTVLENVAFPLKLFTKLSRKLINEIALFKLSLVGLSQDVAHKYPAELSGGMVKRVAIARAIVADPKLIFLDEPTAGLDPESAADFDDLLLFLHKSLRMTVVMVTHDVDTLYKVPDKIAFLGEGRVLAFEPLTTLRQNPHPLVQQYFSSARTIRAETAL